MTETKIIWHRIIKEPGETKNPANASIKIKGSEEAAEQNAVTLSDLQLLIRRDSQQIRGFMEAQLAEVQ